MITRKLPWHGMLSHHVIDRVVRLKERLKVPEVSLLSCSVPLLRAFFILFSLSFTLCLIVLVVVLVVVLYSSLAWIQDTPEPIASMIHECWESDPARRPDMITILDRLTSYWGDLT